MKQLLLLLALISPSFAQLPAIDYAGMFFQVSPAQPIRKVSSLPATCTAVGSASSSNAVLYQGRVYQCSATNTWSFAVGQTAALTSGRVPYVTTGGLLVDDTSLRFDVAQPRLSSTGFLSLGTHNADSSALNIVYAAADFTNGFRLRTSSGNAFFTVDATGTSASMQWKTSNTSRFEHIITGSYWQLFNYGTVATALYVDYSTSKTGVNLGSTPTAQLDIRPLNASTVGQVIRLASTPTANAFQVENSSGTALTRIDASGRFYPVPIAFASLGTPSDGAVVYCSDCTKATPCAGSGNGALAKRLNGAWDCD